MIKRWIMIIVLFTVFVGSVYASENAISIIAGTIYTAETVEKMNQNIDAQDTFHMRFNAKEMLPVGSEKLLKVPDCTFEGEGKVNQTTERIIFKISHITCGNHPPIEIDGFVADVDDNLAGLNARKRKKWLLFGETALSLPKGTMASIILK